jgi:hypothetical protein
MSSFNLRILPDGARVKFSRIEQAADQLRQMQAYAQDRAAEIRRIFGMNASMDVAERRQLESELRDHEKTTKDASEAYRAAAAVATSVSNWVLKLAGNERGHALEEAPRVKPPLQKGEALRACLDRLRKEITTIKNEQYKTALAPLPAKDMKLHADAYVEQMAGRAKVYPHMKDGVFTLNLFGGAPNSAVPSGGVIALLCAFDPERAKEWLHEAVDQLPQPDGVEALSAFDKGQRLKELGGQLDLLERQEEAVVSALIQEGYSGVMRRADASPMALLGVQWARPSALKLPPRRPSNDADEHKPEKGKKSKKRGLARVRPKSSREDDRAARH